jgi:hypothetical protein
MSRGSDVRLGLAGLLTDLEAELEKARLQSDERDLSFRVDGATLEVDVAYTTPSGSLDAPAGVTPDFFVVESTAPGPNDATGSALRHTLRLKLHLSRWPQIADQREPDDVVAPSLPPPAPMPNAPKRD